MDESKLKDEFEYKDGLPPCLIYVDEEGDWYHKGAPIVRKDILEIFYSNLELTPGGLYVIRLKNEECYIEVADTPFVVQQVNVSPSSPDSDKTFLITLKNTGEIERLDLSTLWVGKDNVLYCLVKDGRFPARFSRPAYYQLAKYIEEDTDEERYFIRCNGDKHYIRMSPPDAAAGTGRT